MQTKQQWERLISLVQVLGQTRWCIFNFYMTGNILFLEANHCDNALKQPSLSVYSHWRTTVMDAQSETNADTTPLHTMNPLSRFSDRARDYVKYRPSYSAAAIDTILEGLGNPSQLVAADIGAGTGIASRLLAERRVCVLAIEPNAEMQEAAESHPLVKFCDGTAEVTNLPDASVDLVTCFQVFHWFNPEPSLMEFRRILKRSGQLALVWNNPDRHDEFTSEYSRLVRTISNYHPAESRLKSVEPLLVSPYFINVREHTFVYRQELDLSGLIGRAQSVSYIPREGLAQQHLVSGLQKLYSRTCDDRGLVRLVYCTSVHLAEPQHSTSS